MARRQRNIEAFTDKRGVVHPIRRSSGYDDEKTGSTDFDWRDWAAEEREQRQDEERELKKEYARYHPEAGKSLATFVRQRGGFRYDGIHDGEIDRLRKAETGTTGLVSLDKGKGLTFKRGRGLKPDRMLEAAIEAGVVSPDTSLSRFMDDVEMSATKRNPFPTATVEKAWQAWRKAEKAKSPKAQALETKFVKVYMASQKKNPERTIKHDSTGEVAPAHRVGTTRTGHVIYQYVHGWRPMFSYRQDKDGNWIAKTPRPKRRKNFTIKAAGRLKVGNSGASKFTIKGKHREVKVWLIESPQGGHFWSIGGVGVAKDRATARRLATAFANQPPTWWQLKKPNPKGTADHDAARELTLFILNDYQLYSRRLPSFIANVARKMKAGTYDHQKAAKLYSYLAQEGAKKYSREYSTGRDSAAMFSPATRLETGRQLADHYEQAAREEAERLKQKKPARRKNISIKVGGKTRFKASKKGVSIGGRIQLKANPKPLRTKTLTCSFCKAKQTGKMFPGWLTASPLSGYKWKAKCPSCRQARARLENPGARRVQRLAKAAQTQYGKPTGQAAFERWQQAHRKHHAGIARRGARTKAAKRTLKLWAANPGIFETFTGRKATRQTALNAPDGTPKRLDKLGKLIGLYAENGTIKPRVPVWLCSDSKGKLHLATSAARLIDGGPQSFGEVKKIEYETTKKHLDGKPTVYFHHFGEEGGKRPTLHADGKGGLKLRGGSYKIRAEGIRD